VLVVGSGNLSTEASRVEPQRVSKRTSAAPAASAARTVATCPAPPPPVPSHAARLLLPPSPWAW